MIMHEPIQKPWLITMQRVITPYGHIERITCLWYAMNKTEAWQGMQSQLNEWNDRSRVVSVVPYPEDEPELTCPQCHCTEPIKPGTHCNVCQPRED